MITISPRFILAGQVTEAADPLKAPLYSSMPVSRVSQCADRQEFRTWDS